MSPAPLALALSQGLRFHPFDGGHWPRLAAPTQRTGAASCRPAGKIARWPSSISTIRQ
ncbi:hypothetical protein XAB3213_4450016 [Xanthomonas citri pv. bilvae]|nr:hypothetical protein XAB3213_4450016 [Xanthomonas citri pv. bilvae]